MKYSKKQIKIQTIQILINIIINYFFFQIQQEHFNYFLILSISKIRDQIEQDNSQKKQKRSRNDQIENDDNVEVRRPKRNVEEDEQQSIENDQKQEKKQRKMFKACVYQKKDIKEEKEPSEQQENEIDQNLIEEVIKPFEDSKIDKDMKEYDCKFDTVPIGVPSNLQTFPLLLTTLSKKYPKRRLLGTRQFLLDGGRGSYEWLSYQDFSNLVTIFAQGLKGTFDLSQNPRIGIMSPNRTEWMVLDFALATLGITSVPLYDSQNEQEMLYVIEQADVKTVFCSLDRVNKFKNIVQQLDNLVVFDDRFDDRSLIQQLWQQRGERLRQVSLEDIKFIIQPREQEIFDEFDKEEGIFDPNLNVYEMQPIIQQKNNLGYYNYQVFDIGNVLTKDIKEYPDISLITDLYSRIMMKGYEKLYNINEQNKFEDYSLHITPPLDLVTPDTVLSFVYTSGTTGKPKGVITTQRSVIFEGFVMQKTRIHPMETIVNSLGQINGQMQQYSISYLPCAHIFMRVLNVVTLCVGGCLGFWQGNSKFLLDDVKELRITNFFLVPRIIQKMIKAIKDTISKKSKFEQKIFWSAYNSRKKIVDQVRVQQNIELYQQYLVNQEEDLQSSQQNLLTSSGILDTKLRYPRFEFSNFSNKIFKTFPQLIGGRCYEMVSGSAPCTYQDQEFLTICFNNYMFQGLGLTESCAAGGVERLDNLNFGTIGQPLDSNTKIRLLSVPEMNYTLDHEEIIEINGQKIQINCPCGELLIKGPSVFQGYYKKQIQQNQDISLNTSVDQSYIQYCEANNFSTQVNTNNDQENNSKDENGFYHTKDIAMYNPVFQSLTILDRKSNFVKLNQGEFVSVSKIEAAVCSLLKEAEQCYIFASGVFSGVVAVINTHNIEANEQKINDWIQTLNTELRKQQFKGYEIPVAVLPDNEEWTVDNKLLAPSMKVKRKECQIKYGEICEQIMTKIEADRKINVGELVMQLKAQYRI